jgi:hypothetical protein
MTAFGAKRTLADLLSRRSEDRMLRTVIIWALAALVLGGFLYFAAIVAMNYGVYFIIRP